MARKKKEQSKVKDAQLKGVDFELYGEEYKVGKDELLSLAEEINANLDLDTDDAIDLEAGIKELGASITELFDEIFVSDSFEDEQWATLYKMGCMPVEPADDEEDEEPVKEWPEELMEKIEPLLEDTGESEPEPEPEPKKKGKDKKKKPEPEPEEGDEPEGDEDKPTPESLIAELKKLKSKKNLDQFVEDNDIDVSTAERNPIKLKKQIREAIQGVSAPTKKEEIKEKEEAAPTKKEEIKEKEEAAPTKKKKGMKITPKPDGHSKKSHEDAFMDAIDRLAASLEGAALGELAKKGNDIYCRSNGGSGSVEMQKKQGSLILKVLERYGIVEKEGKKYFLLEEE